MGRRGRELERHRAHDPLTPASQSRDGGAGPFADMIGPLRRQGAKPVLFSISESVWWLIAITATAIFMVGMHVVLTGMNVSDDDTREAPARGAKSRKAFYALAPLLSAVVLGMNLLRPEPSAEILFLYSVAYVAIPVALLPIRGRLVRAYVAHRRDPGAAPEPDRLVTAWIIGFLTVVLIAATVALMAGKYA
ncbi:hypothetical protein [Actinomadura algeriensis]|uniref:Uncharacterized protein n=1 Tax=Actinomadura algeriensis TaxID=1679523 RepID=A0ABR9JW25_9ACTN|nr:hypothetical protein [Actinomadura algeriensis]MBE1534688.1 hypothetical protein [Actinomadura algeriensis]